MKNYVLLGGHNWDESGFYETAMGPIKEVLGLIDEITFIESRFHTWDKNTLGVNRMIKWFIYHGIHLKKVTIVDSRMDLKAQHEAIDHSKALFINGGDTLMQMSTLNKNGLVNLLHNFKGPIIGISAGAINMAKRSVLPLTKIRKRSYEYKGTGLVDVTITPHFDINRKEHLEKEVFPLSYNGLIYGLEEDGAVLVKDGAVSFYGGVYEIRNGLIKKIDQ